MTRIDGATRPRRRRCRVRRASNLVLALLDAAPSGVVVVDNLLSAERENVPDDPRVDVRRGLDRRGRVLAGLDDDLDYVFHLATYHGNQSSIANPIDDHENNLITTLKLYERMKDDRRLRQGRLLGLGLHARRAHLRRGRTDRGGRPVPLDLDSPYQISKVVGEFYSVYYHRMHGLPTVRARFQNVYGPREILGAGRWRGTPATVWRNVTPTFVYRCLKDLPLSSTTADSRAATSSTSGTSYAACILCATRGDAGRRVQPRERRGDVDPRARRAHSHANREASPRSNSGRRGSWDRSGHRFGSTKKAHQQLGFEATTSLEDGLRETIAWTRDHLDLIEAGIERHAVHLAAVP